MPGLTMWKFPSSVMYQAQIAREQMKLWSAEPQQHVDRQPVSTPRRAIKQVTQKYTGSFTISTAILFLLCTVLI